jgi:hypothetical protein
MQRQLVDERRLSGARSSRYSNDQATTGQWKYFLHQLRGVFGGVFYFGDSASYGTDVAGGNTLN